MGDAVRYENQDGVAVIHLDDGKANALSPKVLTDLSECLNRAEKEAQAVVIVGRPGTFCAGFDLKIMGSGASAATELVVTGCNMLLRLYEHPQPVVAACTGHAVAGGAAMLLCCDHRVGAEGDFSVSLNEVRIGLPMPIFISELARDRLNRSAFMQATLGARVHSPSMAVAVGFLDELETADSVLPKALHRARSLAELPASAYASTKLSIRGPLVAHVRSTLEDDMRRVVRDGAF